MSIIGNITTSVTCGVLPFATTGSTVNKDGDIDIESAKLVAISTALTSGTTTAGIALEKHGEAKFKEKMREMHDTQSYIDSLSDEELARLEMLLEAKEVEITENNNYKTM